MRVRPLPPVKRQYGQVRLWSVAFRISSNPYEKAMNAILDHIRRSTSTAKGNVITAGLYLLGVIIFTVLLEANALNITVALFCMFMAGVHSALAFQEGVI
jgi:succinate-acetate transporter protein